MEPSGTTLLRPAGSRQVAPTPLQPPIHPRLAELVTHLTECAPSLAVAAVNASVGDEPATTYDEKLEVLASAVLTVKRHIDLRDGAAPIPGP